LFKGGGPSDETAEKATLKLTLSNIYLKWYYCDRKARAAYAQSFALWQQATIEITRGDHSARTLVITFNRSHVSIGRTSTLRSLFYCLFTLHIYRVFLRAHSVRGEPRIQRNASGVVATVRMIEHSSPKLVVWVQFLVGHTEDWKNGSPVQLRAQRWWLFARKQFTRAAAIGAPHSVWSVGPHFRLLAPCAALLLLQWMLHWWWVNAAPHVNRFLARTHQRRALVSVRLRMLLSNFAAIECVFCLCAENRSNVVCLLHYYWFARTH